MLRKARRCGQSSVARRRCAERSELLCPVRCNVVAVGAGGGTLCGLVLQRNAARALRERGDGLQLLWRADVWSGNVASWAYRSRVLTEVLRRGRKLHRLDVRGACNADVARRGCGVAVGIGEVLSSNSCPNCCIESVIRN